MLSQGKAPLQDRIAKAREKIGRKKGTERLLTSDIRAYTQRIRRLQGRIGGLQRRQATVEADLAPSAPSSSSSRRGCAPSVRGSSGCAPGCA
jgi:hypothetical protein